MVDEGLTQPAQSGSGAGNAGDMKRWLVIAAAMAIAVAAWRVEAAATIGRALGAAGVPLSAAFGLIALALAAALVAWLALARARRERRAANRLKALVGGVGAARPAAPHPIAVAKAEMRTPPRPASDEPVAPIELLLQPVVDQSLNAAAGFDAVFSGSSPGGEVETDRARLRVAAEAMALRPAALDEKRPVFVAVSAAFLKDPNSRHFLASLMRGRPNVARGLKLIAPAHLRLARPDDFPRLGVDLALTGEAMAGAPPPARASHFRLAADDLLSPHAARRLTAWRKVEWARAQGLVVIATGIGEAGDAARLVDMGVDLMTGPALAGPLRLRAVAVEDESVPARRLHRRPGPGRAAG